MTQAKLFPDLIRMGEKAKMAVRRLRRMQTPQKNRCIEALADAVLNHQQAIIDATRQDLDETRDSNLFHESEGVEAATPESLQQVARILRKLAGQPDPVGRVDSTWIRPNGLAIKKVRVAIGVIGVAFHGQMDSVLISAALCIKSNNAALLCTDSHWQKTNQVLRHILKEVLVGNDYPEDTVHIVTSSSPEAYRAFLTMDAYIDLLIPKGTPAFIAQVRQYSRIPMLISSRGVCHIYIDREANLEDALNILADARNTRQAHAVDTLLLHADIAEEFLPLLTSWAAEASVQLIGDPNENFHLSGVNASRPATWTTERGPGELAVKVVANVEEAVDHIANYGAGYSDAIVTQSKQRANYFSESVDAAAVYINASTRFTDAQQFGMGPQILVGTGHFHARGPIGVEELTTYKYVIIGKGQIRE